MFGIFSAFKQFFSDAPPKTKVETQDEKQARHRQHALEFAKQQHSTLSVKQRQHGYQVETTPTTGDFGADLLLMGKIMG